MKVFSPVFILLIMIVGSSNARSQTVTGISIQSANGYEISEAGGSLLLNANIFPINAADPSVSWSVINTDGIGVIDSETGLFTAVSNGISSVTACANGAYGICDVVDIYMLNQINDGVCEIVDEDFESNILSLNWVGDTSKFHISSNFAGTGSNAIRCENTDNNSNGALSPDEGMVYSFSDPNPQYVAYRLKTDINDPVRTGTIIVGDNDLTTLGNMYYVNSYSSSIRIIGASPIFYPADPNEWYFIEYYNIDWENHKSDLYIDHELIQKDFSFRNPIDKITNVYLSNNMPYDMYFDDIVIGSRINNFNETVSLCNNENYIFPDSSSIDNVTSDTIHTSIIFSNNDSCKTIINTILEVEDCLSLIEEEQISEVSIFPDPTTGKFTIYNPYDNDKAIDLKLMDLSTKFILHRSIPADQQYIDIDISNRSNGVYIVLLTMDDHISTRKVIKY